MNIFRIPVDNQHFRDTIENGKSIQEIERFLSSEEKNRAKKSAKDGVVRYWGSIPGESNRRNFQRLAEGDEILCYRSGKYIALAIISFTTTNRNLAKYSWGETDLGTTWELIYFFRDVYFFQIDSALINQEFEFKDGPVMGFNAISSGKSSEFFKKHESVKKFVGGLGQEQKKEEKAFDQLSKAAISSPFEAQFYLVDLGNNLEYNTYVPTSDAGHSVFGKKIEELITVRTEDLSQYVGPALLDPLCHIDVIWFKDSFRPKYFFEVINKTGWSEAFLRLDLVGKSYESAKTRIIGPKDNEEKFRNALRRWSGPKEELAYKNYDQLLNTHLEVSRFKSVLNDFLA
ncbi:MAG: hypothetical protein A2W22_04820 [Candidatus Levybacteria bacterium RBG_16_35_11]|nr:MAG: hypothetical protein A2W22_04820 [Candidatus Levybacteria bacterium RBG_16_35_11]